MTIHSIFVVAFKMQVFCHKIVATVGCGFIWWWWLFFLFCVFWFAYGLVLVCVFFFVVFKECSNIWIYLYRYFLFSLLQALNVVIEFHLIDCGINIIGVMHNFLCAYVLFSFPTVV